MERDQCKCRHCIVGQETAGRKNSGGGGRGGGGQTKEEQEQLVNVFLKRVDLAWVAGTNSSAPLIGQLQRSGSCPNPHHLHSASP
jgi:hypothetical protein